MSKLVLVRCKKCGKEFHVQEKTYRMRGVNPEFYCKKCQEKTKREQIQQNIRKLYESGVCIVKWMVHFMNTNFAVSVDKITCQECVDYHAGVCRGEQRPNPITCFSTHQKPTKGEPILETPQGVIECPGICKICYDKMFGKGWDEYE